MQLKQSVLMVIVLLAGCGFAFGGWTQWQGSADGDWNTGSNWDNGVPTTGGSYDSAGISTGAGPLIEAGDAASAGSQVTLNYTDGDSGTTSSAVQLTMTGGSLVSARLDVGNNVDWSIFQMSGGDVDISNDVYIGFGAGGVRAGLGRVTMSGGTIDIADTLYIANNYVDAKGELYLDDGTVTARILRMGTGGAPGSNAKMVITDGTLVLNTVAPAEKALVQQYIDNGMITAGGSYTSISMVEDTQAGTLTLTAIPEPTTLAIVMAGLAGVGLLRKQR